MNPAGNTKTNAQRLSRCFGLFSSKPGAVAHFADIISETSDGNDNDWPNVNNQGQSPRSATSGEAPSNPAQEIEVNTLPMATDKKPILRKSTAVPEKPNPESNAHPKTNVQRENVSRDENEDCNERDNEKLKTDIDDVEELDLVSSTGIDSNVNASDVKAQNLQFPDTSMANDAVQAAHSTFAEASSNNDEKRFKCSHCSYSTNYSGHLLNHSRIHPKEKSFKCNQCSYACPQSSVLKLHMRTHTKEKLYKCDKCSYACAQFGGLKSHMRTHIGKETYKCTQCSYATVFFVALQRHMRTHN